MSAPRSDIPAGSVWRQVKLGSEAVYEVITVGADTVDVVVRVAPGLARGTRVRLSRAAVEAMQRVVEPDRHGSGAPKRSAHGQRANPRER
jgi:hypothetical protein